MSCLSVVKRKTAQKVVRGAWSPTLNAEECESNVRREGKNVQRPTSNIELGKHFPIER